MLKKILFFLMVLIILTGCSLTGGYDSSKAIKRGDITILHTGVHNLERFEQFLEHLVNSQEDTVRVTSYTKEGDPSSKIYILMGRTFNIRMIIHMMHLEGRTKGKRQMFAKI